MLLQVTNIGGQQIFQSGGQQYLIVNKAGSGGRIQIVDQQDSAATRESGVLGEDGRGNCDVFEPRIIASIVFQMQSEGGRSSRDNQATAKYLTT